MRLRYFKMGFDPSLTWHCLRIINIFAFKNIICITYILYTHNAKSYIKGFLDRNQELNCVNLPIFSSLLLLTVLQIHIYDSPMH